MTKNSLIKNRYLLLVYLLVATITSIGQDISRQEADTIIKTIEKNNHPVTRMTLLLNLAQFHISKTGNSEIDFDSAKLYINEAKALNKTVRSAAVDGYTLLTESYITKEKGNKDQGKKMVEKAVAILKPGNNNPFLGRALFELSMYYSYQDSLEYIKRIDLVNQSINAFDKGSDYKGKGKALEMLGDLYIQKGNNAMAITVLKQAQAAFEAINYTKLQGVHVLLATAYQEQLEFGQALFYALKALKTARMLNDTSMQICQIYNQLGRLYQEIGKFDISLMYLQDALSVAKKNNDEEAVFVLAVNMSASFHEINRSDEALKVLSYIPRNYLVSDDNFTKFMSNMCYLRAHNQLRQYDKARPYLNIVLKLADAKLIPDQRRCNGYKYVADYYAGTNQYAKAHYYLTESKDLAERFNLDLARTHGLRSAYLLDSAQGNFRSAYKHLSMYKAKTDSITSERTARQFQVLSIEHEVGMKEDSIRSKNNDILLLKQANSLQEANLKQASLIKKVTIGGIVVACIIIGLLYRQYRQKQKSNQVITHKNGHLQHLLTEKEWLLKEIHHRVKNNLQIVMSLLNSQTAYIDNEPALTAIHDSQHRVHAMSLIHQKLYNTENVSTIDMPSYIRELASYLSDSFNTGQLIRFEYNIAPLEMDVSHAVPLGLILNEAITNSIKYAFPDNRYGLINISLLNTTSNDYLLSISDNGIGMPDHFPGRKPGSLGMSLIAGLSKDLEGSFSIENNNGTVVKISFVREVSVKRPDASAV